ncbi:probable G-protein coupled receptor 141 [Hemicordylus capensis]|uniref:probable G-protein coupled receptor 141 n=1 Tax=Hemicordylus capensis TaxID=884348 RepID=UPI002303A494|nr:probable G-protein coupled receptor 141 [Hemicordylus capensis]
MGACGAKGWRNMTEDDAIRTALEQFERTDAYRIFNAVLVTIYFVVLAGGVCGVIKMSFLLVKMNTLSVTTTAIINLVAIHSLFLVTVPFRLYYYISKNWVFGQYFCRFVSLMAHFHMYLTFLFYVIALIIRFLIFFQWKDKVEFYRNLHAVATSAVVWILTLALVLPLMHVCYGRNGNYQNNTCFQFQQELKKDGVKALNYVIITGVVLVTFGLLGLQVVIILKIVRKLSGSVWSHQEFRAQLKNLIFVCFIIFCFLPHHFFRIYYIQHVNDNQNLEIYNEICLSITAVSCLDLFPFVISGGRLMRQKTMGLSCC